MGSRPAPGTSPASARALLRHPTPEVGDLRLQRQLAEACRTFGSSVTGGNVSFYNDTEGLSIHPTPVLGIVGLLEDIGKAVSPGFKAAGDAVVLFGEIFEEIGGSEYLKTVHGLEAGAPPVIDLELERRTQECVLEAIEAGWLRSAHDLSEGGLAVGLAECAFHSGRGLGCEIELDGGMRADALLFGESQSRVLATSRKADAAKLLALAARRGVPAKLIGRFGGREIALRRAGVDLLRVPVETAFRAWKDSLPAFFKVPA